MNARDIRKIRCLDALHYSFQILRHYHSRLWEDCCKLHQDNSQIVSVLAGCWGFIDSMHRVREIAQSIPDLSVKHPEMRAFLSASKHAEDYRHYIQHLRGELAKNPPNTFPVWGSISWTDKDNPQKSHTVFLGTHLSDTQNTSGVYDVKEQKWVSNVSLGIGDITFNFDKVFESAARFEEFCIPYLRNSLDVKLNFRDKLPIMSLEIGTKNPGFQPPT